MKAFKYSVGIDADSKKHEVCMMEMDCEQRTRTLSTRSFTNSEFSKLVEWIEKHRKDKSLPLAIVMEATGVYHEELAWFLHTSAYGISIVLPNKSRHYMHAIGLKSKNDKIDAKGLAQMGAEQLLEQWTPISEQLYELRTLTRHHEALQQTKTGIHNQVHALEHSRAQAPEVFANLKQILELLDKQLDQTKVLISKVVEQDQELHAQFERICKIKGVATLTLATIVAETDGFALMKNQRQLVSYAGYDVVENQSGKSKGKTRISKKGNAHIRRILHMAAINTVRYEKGRFEALRERVHQRSAVKMKGNVAVQRKLLCIIYTLWQSQQDWNPEHHLMESGNQETKTLFGHAASSGKKNAGRSNDPPAVDGLPSNQSTEDLFGLDKIRKKKAQNICI